MLRRPFDTIRCTYFYSNNFFTILNNFLNFVPSYFSLIIGRGIGIWRGRREEDGGLMNRLHDTWPTSTERPLSLLMTLGRSASSIYYESIIGWSHPPVLGYSTIISDTSMLRPRLEGSSLDGGSGECHQAQTSFTVIIVSFSRRTWPLLHMRPIDPIVDAEDATTSPLSSRHHILEPTSNASHESAGGKKVRARKIYRTFSSIFTFFSSRACSVRGILTKPTAPAEHPQPLKLHQSLR
jgi:hypothetical protein